MTSTTCSSKSTKNKTLVCWTGVKVSVLFAVYREVSAKGRGEYYYEGNVCLIDAYIKLLAPTYNILGMNFS